MYGIVHHCRSSLPPNVNEIGYLLRLWITTVKINNKLTDGFIVWSALFFALVFAVAAFTGLATRGHQTMGVRQTDVAAAEILSARTDSVGDPSSPYTLVEFADYECPPCRASYRKLHDLASVRYRGKVKLMFRNLPLTEIHPMAMRAAVTAEEARQLGKFWPVHDLLFSGPIDTDSLRHRLGVLQIDPARLDTRRPAAEKTVQADLKLASRLGLQSTPSLVLCAPGGETYVLTSADQIEKVIP